jgi:hypothetical protein
MFSGDGINLPEWGKKVSSRYLPDLPNQFEIAKNYVKCVKCCKIKFVSNIDVPFV